ncbi:hypothetical protein [Burkholderia glumae]|uniref:hypothetical protein n=1 Tax=Burkholderia glumae TaxID=337 RepID=UPI0001A4ADFC|nr:hypothetical protein [Burkholderia glumae]ACR28680.1 Hypothetical protein bglu_1g15380 [Burkholderia glumae BGR1]KHJ64688.1 hypothetical protein NCPPB3923_01555 [Burkholderia glumae]MCQ0032546.1 hypothetical protein [Burkholderia glumae]MCQ0035816.1 hypothetical protein [Burkholderia glumae]RQZ76422.1 hypothetical protein DF052_00255 [Burkholderia glumae]
MAFSFNLGDRVAIAASGETGKIIGRADYAESAKSYFVRYKAADRRAVEAWWSEGALDWLTRTSRNSDE